LAFYAVTRKFVMQPDAEIGMPNAPIVGGQIELGGIVEPVGVGVGKEFDQPVEGGDPPIEGECLTEIEEPAKVVRNGAPAAQADNAGRNERFAGQSFPAHS
jgi:hypothetical protein